MDEPARKIKSGWLRIALVRTRKTFYLPTWLITSIVLMSAIFCQLIEYPQPRNPTLQGDVSAVGAPPQLGWPISYLQYSGRTLKKIYSPQGIVFNAIACLLVLLSVIVATESALDAYVYRTRVGLQWLFVTTFIIAAFFGLSRTHMGHAILYVPLFVQVMMIYGIGCLNYAVLKSFVTVLKELD